MNPSNRINNLNIQDSDSLINDNAIISSLSFVNDFSSEILCTNDSLSTSSLCIDSMQEEEMRDEKKEDILVSSAYDINSVEEEMVSFVEDDSKSVFSFTDMSNNEESLTKRCKSNSFIELEENVKSSVKFINDLVLSLSQDTAVVDDEEYLKDYENVDIKIPSGFTTGKNKAILIDPKNIINTQYEILDVNRIESGFTTGTNKSILINAANISNSLLNNNESINIENGSVELVDNIKANDKTKIDNNKIESGFITGKNKAILIDPANIDNNLLNNDESTNKIDININTNIDNINNDSKNTDNTNNDESINKIKDKVESGFLTGNNKTILIDPANIKTSQFDSSNTLNTSIIKESMNNFKISPHRANTSNNLNTDKDSLIKESLHKTNNCNNNNTNTLNKDKDKNALIKESLHNKNNPNNNCTNNKTNDINCTNTIKTNNNKTIKTNNKNEDSLIKEAFSIVNKHFKKQEKPWIFQNFKWSWLHLFLNNELNKNIEELSKNLIEIMELKKKYERSILRRIVEFDDVSFRFMVLGVIEYSESSILLFDGFYALNFKIDKNVYVFLKSKQCAIGTKLFVFGSKLLIKEATSIFDIKGIPLELYYNSIKICSDSFILGKAKKISFLNNISSLRPDGGIVSSLIVKIKEIVEQKYYVSVENYRNRVDDLEKEIEKILEIANKTGYRMNIENITVKQYVKVVIEDNTGECKLTWWNPPEIKVGEKYKLVYLNAIEGYGMNLSTTRTSYFEKLR